MPFLNVPLSYRCLSFPPLHFKRRLNDLWTLIFLGKSGIRPPINAIKTTEKKWRIMDVNLRLRRW